MMNYTDEEILALVGRKPVERKIKRLKKFYKDKVVLVTGGAGSIGTELVKLLIELEAKVVVFDWWENGVFFLQQEFPEIECYVGDVKTKRIGKVIEKVKPDIIVHASAYKHCPLMQDNPIDCFNNNVWGTLNTMENAITYGVKNFVLISTDKAVNPTSVMGATKRICELLMQSKKSGTIFNAVRFGNVIQSNGSVVPIFLKQIKEEKDLTVTSRKITRYFMSKKEAVELILLSAIIAKNGNIFLLDMGEPVKIYNLAKALVKDTKSKSKIKITGLRKGEKLFEELTYDDKKMQKTKEDKIFRVKKIGKINEEQIREALMSTMNFLPTDDEMYSFINSLGFNIKKK